MNRYWPLILIISLPLLWQARPYDQKKKVHLIATVKNCGGELGLYKFDGIDFILLQRSPEKEKDQYSFQWPQGDASIIYLGKKDAQKLPVVVGPEAAVQLTSNCPSIRKATFTNSPLNNQYNEVIQAIRRQKGRRNQLMRQVQRSNGFPEMLKKAEEAMADYEMEKSIYIDSMMGENPFLGKLAALNGYISYAADKKGYPNELEHYGKEFFANTPLEDQAYDELTFLFEAFREFTGTLAKLNLDKAILNGYLDHNLQRIDKKRAAFKNALGGIVLALQQANHPSFLDYGKLYLSHYEHEQTDHLKKLAGSLENAKALLVGGQAPQLSGQDPDGQTIQLSDLQGKYVLIDFWASWCGPCRKENPKVVGLYEKYKDKGFEILGVSLDRDRARWVKAIADDGLSWPQISDLKGWKSSHAATYGVRSIPTTVLLDQQGKIIARNLRAHQLESRLAELLP